MKLNVHLKHCERDSHLILQKRHSYSLLYDDFFFFFELDQRPDLYFFHSCSPVCVIQTYKPFNLLIELVSLRVLKLAILILYKFPVMLRKRSNVLHFYGLPCQVMMWTFQYSFIIGKCQDVLFHASNSTWILRNGYTHLLIMWTWRF